MQGQRSTIGPLPDSINFEYGSPTANVGIDRQLCWNNLRGPSENNLPDYRIAGGGSDSLMDSIRQEGRGQSRWNIGEPGPSNLPNLMSNEERMMQNGWHSTTSLSSSIPGPALGPGFDAPLHEPASVISRNSVNLNLSSNHIADGSSLVRGSDSHSSSRNLDINTEFVSRVGATSEDYMECSSSKSGGLEPHLVASSSGTSEPFASASGCDEILVEDDDGRPGCPIDSRRMSCKRKSLEGQSSQSSGSGSCFSREGRSIWQAAPSSYHVGGSSLELYPSLETPVGAGTPEFVNPGLGLGMGGVSSDNGLPPSNLCVGVGDSLERSYQARTNLSNQHDSVSNNRFVPRVRGSHSGSLSTHQPLRLIPLHPPLDLMPQIRHDNAAAAQGQPDVSRFPGLRRNIPTPRWADCPSISRAGGSSVVTGERDVSSLQEDLNSRTRPRNISEHPMLIPSAEVRNPPGSTTNWILNNGHRAGMSRSMASSSRVRQTSSHSSSSGLSLGSQRQPSSQYTRRFSEHVIRRHLMSVSEPDGGVHGGSGPTPRSSSQEVISSGGGHTHPLSRSSALLMERHGNGGVGGPYTLRGEGRSSRLVSEIRNVLDIVRRGEGGLTIEDIMIFEANMLFGMPDINDQHRDMRLDVDNMSYEELLALEERIGNVCTGLSEESVMARMKRRKYVLTMKEDQMEPEPCCICQEEYNEGEDLGTLDCGHDFHSECVKQWLAQKNLCPICKTTGLGARRN